MKQIPQITKGTEKMVYHSLLIIICVYPFYSYLPVILDLNQTLFYLTRKETKIHSIANLKFQASIA